MRNLFKKQAPIIIISYRDYKHFNHDLFRNELLRDLYNWDSGKINYDTFEEIIIMLLNQHAPFKERFVRANNSPFMNKPLSKAVMTRSRLWNKFIRNPIHENKSLIIWVIEITVLGLFRKEKKLFYNNLGTNLVTDNRKFWKTVKPLFSEKHFSNNKIILLKGEEIISYEKENSRKHSMLILPNLLLI